MAKLKNHTELLQDDLFLQWRLFPTEELGDYWNKKIIEDPNLKVEIGIADNYIQEKYFKNDGLSSIEKDYLISSISKSLNEKTKPKSKTIAMKVWLKYVAIFILVVSTSITLSLILNKPSAINEANQENIVGNIHEESDIQLLVGDKIITYNQDIDIELSDEGEIRVDKEVVNKDDSSNEIKMNKIVVPHGKRSKIKLSDNSVIWINSGSSIEFPSKFETHQRDIILSKGECFLEVTPDATKPFVVQTSKMKVRVHGTSFNVSAYENEHQNVVLVEGSVSIETNNGSSPFYITPNEKALIGSDNSITKQIVNTELYTSWRDGYLLFNNTPMIDVLNQLERYYNLTFNYDNNKNINNIKCNGKLILSDNIENVLQTISIITSTKYLIDAKTIIISNKTKEND